jgi:argininosuccinate lyase
MDAVADRDFIIEFLAAASICHAPFQPLVRGDDPVVDRPSSGSSKFPMPFPPAAASCPRRKNPDIAELVRGKTGRVIGDLVAMLTIMKSLPMAYNRDLQEDKEPLFDAVDTLSACVDIYTRMLPEITIRKDRMLKAAATGYLNATDLADYLVSLDIPFREAHSCAGKAVAYAIESRRELHELSLEELQQFAPEIADNVFDLLKPESVVNRRTSFGGTAAENVTAAIAEAKKEMEKEIPGLPEF